MKNRICRLFGTRLPIVQGGMVWCSGWKLASAVSNAGGLGLLGSGSMYPDVFREQLVKLREHTNRPYGVNVPLIYKHAPEIMEIVLEEKIPVVFTSAGNPASWTAALQERGSLVVHVIASSRFAEKAVAAGVDALVAEGFEAGGHNGREETTTFALLPAIRQVTDLPLLAAGGIATGRAMLAAMALGADGVQIGSRFAVAAESSAHPAFKQKIVETREGDTMLSLKKLTPVRLVKNSFWQRIEEAESRGATPEELAAILGTGRARQGIFEGELEEGELEIGQVSALINRIEPAASIIQEIMEEYRAALHEIVNQPEKYSFTDDDDRI